MKSNLRVSHSCNLMCKKNQKGIFSKECQMLITQGKYENTYRPTVVFGIIKSFKNRSNLNNFY